jgi:TonB family protein
MRQVEQPHQVISLSRGLVQRANAPIAQPPAPMASSIVAKPAVSKPAAAKPVPRQGLADGSLWGTVYDGTGAVVPGVTITIANERIAEQMATGDAGQFEFRALTPGRYTLTAGFPGFMTANISGIEIRSAQASHQNVTLSVGRIAERVTVSVAGQPKPAVLPGVPQRIRVGGNVQAANLISQVRPIYPQTARDGGIEGTVHLQGIIGADGTLIGLRVISSNDPDLAAAALESVRQWRYRPTLLNNVPVEVITEIDVDFKLVQ